MFTSEICEALQYYVYRLIDPRNGETFYVAKGKNNRVFEHAKGEADAVEVAISQKIERIRDIRISGFDVGHVIHRHGLNKDTAYEVEAALIGVYPATTNIMSGHYSGERGVMHSRQIIEQYQADEIIFYHDVMLINIGVSALQHSAIYEAVRYAWKIDVTRARKAQYILAVCSGLVVGVFVPEIWLEATTEHFPDRESKQGRWGFIGCDAPSDITKTYLRKRVPSSMRKKGSANPIRYSY